MRIQLVALLMLILCPQSRADEKLTPGAAIDFEPLAFYPERWKENDVPLTMYPWVGKQVVFLTTDAKLEGKVMAGLLGHLDQGWQLYAELTGESPNLFKQYQGKPTLAAVPEFKLTCGYGCGYVGATGIELGAFYRSDYKNIQANPKAVPDYYFYEMGRNYFTFGDRHSLFTTGYAVFMRYVCVDNLGLTTDAKTRTTIENAEAEYAKADMPFMKAFTTLDGLSEKENRLETAPTDQPVMYASAMLKLRSELGDAWLARFFRVLSQCPKVKPTDTKTGLRQAMNWYVAASYAASKDLSPVFVDRWRLPLSEVGRAATAKIDWSEQDADLQETLDRLLAP